MPVIVGPALWYRFRLGKAAPDGGNTICKSGGTAWIAAPASSEVGRTWYCINDAVITATNCTSATGWFVPTIGQLQNPGYCCRTYWDSYSSATYWSSTQALNISFGCLLNSNGNAGEIFKANTFRVRAFRCVTY